MKSNFIKLIVFGAAGRMGSRILDLASQDDTFEIVGAIEAKGSVRVGEEISLSGGLNGKQKLSISDNLSDIINQSNVLIDFTQPDATLEHVAEALHAKKAIVIGTTGLSKTQMEELAEASKKIPIVQAPNMSVGMNVMFRLAEMLGEQLNDNYDVEIVEAHHRFKNDAPSGSALEIARQVAKGRKVNLDQEAIYGRKGFTGERKKGSIGIHALRGGDVVGEHTINFLTQGEMISLTHKASSRDAFASGALHAAKFVHNKRSGLYDMQDVLGLK
ncbi:MAG: 4-hydroxy-tetrahydrodipicolinate reductase [Candidatus Omnitrophica bacterium]|nr:4-hydroxy-tetrahydrodipicolinate reductase [Candidatus Omnitrophota bacterium]